MITVTVYGETYECETAYKGSDYIRLLDANGMVTASFTGISDFSAFSITGGSWSTPAEPDDSPIMVALGDGDWLLYGYCHILEWEWGYVMFSELSSLRLPWGMTIERDLYSSGTVHKLANLEENK